MMWFLAAMTNTIKVWIHRHLESRIFQRREYAWRQKEVIEQINH